MVIVVSKRHQEVGCLLVFIVLCIAVVIGMRYTGRLLVPLILGGGGVSPVNDPRHSFEYRTGIALSASTTVESTGDNHGGFHGDGEVYIVLKSDRQDLERLLNESSPWGEQWQRGPVPFGIIRSAAFGRLEGIVQREVLGVVEYSGDSVIKRFHTSKEIWWVAKDRSAATSPVWHNGSVLVMDPENERIWLSDWDY